MESLFQWVKRPRGKSQLVAAPGVKAGGPQFCVVHGSIHRHAGDSRMRSSLLAAFAWSVLIASTSLAVDWPQWRGPNRDAKVAGFTPPATWPAELTKKWSVSVGDGVATPALVGDKIFTFTRQGDEEVTTCLDAASGKQIWQDKYTAQA